MSSIETKDLDTELFLVLLFIDLYLGTTLDEILEHSSADIAEVENGLFLVFIRDVMELPDFADYDSFTFDQRTHAAFLEYSQ